MKLYYYSSEFVTMTEAKWIIAKFFAYGILIGVIIFFSLVKLDQSFPNASEAHSVNALVLENKILQQQLSLLLPQVNTMELQSRQLYERAGVLNILLNKRKSILDTIPNIIVANNGFKH